MRQLTITLAMMVMAVSHLIAQEELFRKEKSTDQIPIVVAAGDTVHLSNGWVVIVPTAAEPDYTGYTVQQRLDAGQTPKQIYDSGIPLDSLYGKTYQGGLIFFLHPPSGAGLVAAPSDQGIFGVFNLRWGCGLDAWGGATLVGANGFAIGTGSQNTIDIASVCGNSTAADVCADLVLGGHSDWFLPSKDELNEMYINLKSNGFGGFAINTYWSSTEASLTSAWRQNFLYGQQTDGLKDFEYRVRAVRTF